MQVSPYMQLTGLSLGPRLCLLLLLFQVDHLMQTKYKEFKFVDMEKAVCPLMCTKNESLFIGSLAAVK